MTTRPYSLLLVSLVVFSFPQIASAQQMADPTFNALVAQPAYRKNFPRILFDEAHNNFHTTIGRYKPFADLVSNDGYHVVRNRNPFRKESLSTFKILVIANALGAEEVDEEGADHSAFTDEECDEVRDWVRGGGALLLIADHAPFGGAAENLARRFGVEMTKGITYDPEHSLPGNPSLLLFSRDNKLLLDHPITDGRNEAEKINRVLTFSGQSLSGPAGSEFLRLGESARNRADRNSTRENSDAGRAQGLAFKFGKGRVVVLGEAAMLSAQIAGAEKTQLGMNVPGSDDRQLALNIMHWLSGLLK